MKHPVSVQQLNELINTDPTLQIVDVRSCGEYSAGHVPRAINIPLEEIENRLGDLGAGPVAIICQSGMRAEMACDLLEQARPNLVHVEGGTDAWVEAGHPVTASTSSRWALERQTRLGAGILVLAGTLLSLFLSPNWIYLAVFIGAGLTFAGLSNICGMGLLLRLMPWNKPPKSTLTSSAPTGASP